MSPVLMLIVASFVGSSVKRAHPQASWSELILLSVIYGGVGAVVSLIWTFHSMDVYEKETDYSAGNGPLGWIFLYGPLSFAFGQTLALLHWWLRQRRRLPKPNDHDLRKSTDAEEELL